MNVSQLETLGMACTWGLGVLSHTFAITIGVLYQGWQHWARERTERRGAPAAPAAPQIPGEKQSHTPKPRQDQLLEVEAICRCISPIRAYCWKPRKFCVIVWQYLPDANTNIFFYWLSSSFFWHVRPFSSARLQTAGSCKENDWLWSHSPDFERQLCSFQTWFLNLWNKNKNTCTTFSWVSYIKHPAYIRLYSTNEW